MDSDLDALKQRAEAAEAKLSAIKQKRKETMQRYYKKRELEGRVQISLVISKESNEIINSIRSQSILDKVELSAGQIVDRALKLYNESINRPIETKKNIPTLKPLIKPLESTQTEIDDKPQHLTVSEIQALCERLKHKDKSIQDYNEVSNFLRKRGLTNADIHTMFIEHKILSVSGKHITIANVKKWK